MIVFLIPVSIIVIVISIGKIIKNGGYKENKVSFWKNLTSMIVSILVIYFSIVTPSSFISKSYANSDKTMTVVEYSISDDSSTIENVKRPTTKCKVTETYYPIYDYDVDYN